MSFTARALQLLETEMNKNLSISYSIVENGGPSGRRVIRKDQPFRVEVWVRNDSTISMLNIRGAVHPTAIARFDVARFEIARLGPRATQKVATLEATIVDVPNQRNVLDLIATVNVAGQADLSSFWYRANSRPVGYAQQSPKGSVRNRENKPFAGQRTSKVHNFRTPQAEAS